MSLSHVYSSDFSFSFPAPKSPGESLSVRFEETLALRLRSLLASPPCISLSWLSSAVNLLAGTLADAGEFLARRSDAASLAGYLDAGGSIALLDACNAACAGIERLRRCLLPLRLALYLLAGAGDVSRPPPPESLRRARDAIAEWERRPKREIKGSSDDLIRRLSPADQPRGKISALGKAIYAVEAVASLVMTAVITALEGRGKGEAGFAGISVSGEFRWAEAFNSVSAAVAAGLGEGFSGVVEPVEARVSTLTAVIDESREDDGKKTDRLRSAVGELEKASEELTEGLDRLADAVNGLFRAAMATRNTALQSLRVTVNKGK